jgi:hypothetical protein
VSALSELRAGQPAEAFVELVSRTVRAVAISRNFPPPDEHDRWDSEAVEAATAAFFASRQTPRRLTDLRLSCNTEDGLRRRLQTTVRNFLADVGRKTDVGRLVLRINEVLDSDPAFVRIDQRWTLAGAAEGAVEADFDELVAVASGVHVDVPTAWTKTSRRKSPEIDRGSVVRLCHTLLTRAGGSLRTSLIAQVVARRLGIGLTPLTIDATAFDPPQMEGPARDATSEAVVVLLRANEVLALLNDSERIAIGLPHLSIRELSRVLGVSKSQAGLVRLRAVNTLTAELCDEESGQEVGETVLSLAREWTNSWTIDRDST